MNDSRRFPFLPEVVSGETADLYFTRTQHVLDELARDPVVGFEVFPRERGLVCGVSQVVQLLSDIGFQGEMSAIPEGEWADRGEAVVEIVAPYSQFGKFETAILGILASSPGWATASREVVEAAGDVPVVSFGARHVHPNVSAFMDYAAVVGGCRTCSTPLGSRLAGTRPAGTMAHAYILIVGDTVEAAQAFDRLMPTDVPRTVLVDTFEDPAVESVAVARALGPALGAVRLDTPGERGGVTPELVIEIRARLDLAGHSRVHIMVTGGVTPERIRKFSEAAAPVDMYGVGSYISGAAAIDYTGDIREVDGQPVAKLGRIPGMQRHSRLQVMTAG